MIRSRDVISAPLDHAMLATRVIAALDQVGKSGPPPLLQGALGDAVRFLESIVEGREYTNKREVSEKSYESALAYGEAIRAIRLLPVSKGSKTEPVTLITRLLAAAQALSRDEKVDENQMKELTNFFRGVRDITLQLDRRPIEVLSFPE